MENLDIIHQYIEAFNKKDVDGCFKYLSDDLRVFKLPNNDIHLENKEKARDHYLDSIKNGSFLPIRLISEMQLGDYVTLIIDKSNGKESRKATVINLFQNGIIKKMWIAPDDKLPSN